MKRWHLYYLAFLLLANAYRFVHPTLSWGLDFQIYWNAHLGNFDRLIRGVFTYGYVYTDIPLVVFHLLGWVTSNNFWLAHYIWFVFQGMCAVHIVIELFKLKHGWLYATLSLKIFIWLIYVGNIYPSLLVLCLSPLGTLIAMLVKPQLAIIGVVVIATQIYRHRLWRNVPVVGSNCSINNLNCSEAKRKIRFSDFWSWDNFLCR